MGIDEDSGSLCDLVEKKMEELAEQNNSYFKCNCKSEPADVDGKSVSKKEDRSGGWQEFLIEPNCSNYEGGYYVLGEGLNTSGGKCSLGGTCPYCSTKGFNFPSY